MSNSLFSFLFQKIPKKKIKKHFSYPDGLFLHVGNLPQSQEPVFIPEKGLFQNILITGTIGSGKTSSSMYPFTFQLLQYHCENDDRLGMLVLDVKGNFYEHVLSCCTELDREDDLIILEINGKFKYNPLHKPDLKPSLLANRLKSVLELFSTNTSDSYWFDKVEETLTECIKLCRLYNQRLCHFSRDS